MQVGEIMEGGKKRETTDRAPTREEYSDWKKKRKRMWYLRR